MTQSKKSNDYITVDLGAEQYTTTTYWDGDSVTDITINTIDDGTFTITDDSIDISSISWDFGNKIDPSEVEKMCKEYPALDKVWRNFKSVYDMTKQDFEGKVKAGEIDDDIPF